MASQDVWPLRSGAAPDDSRPAVKRPTGHRILTSATASGDAMFLDAEPVSRHAHGQVAERIGLGIVRGDITPGDALPSELRISEMVGVSRPVVREAIRILIGKGFLETRPKSGTRVRAPENWNYLDPDVLRWRLSVAGIDDYLRKLFQLRHALDPAASAIAAASARPDDIGRIRHAYEGMCAAKVNDAFVSADIAFHKGIYFATRNELFMPIAQMFDVALRQSFGLAATGDHRRRALDEHGAVLRAISDGDIERARQTTVLLLANSVDDLVTIRGAGDRATIEGPPRPRTPDA